MDAEETQHKLTPLTQTKLVIVEGVDEENFFGALKAHLRLSGIEIRNFGGKNKLHPYLRTLVITPGFPNVASLAVVRDANSDNAFQSIQDGLKAAGLAVPAMPLVPEGTSPRVIALVLPHGENTGMLEDVCLQAVVDDPAMQCLEVYFQCIQERVTEPPQNMSKARVHVFLASRPQPDLRLGEAAQRGYWPFNAPAFGPLKQLLQML